MAVTYDKYYLTENLFGEPYPELIEFMSNYPIKGKLLDLGCGQGRDAIPLAQLGYAITGIDNSRVGIDQMNLIARKRNLDLNGQLGDIHLFDRFYEFDIVLLDSMFHFAKKDKEREIGLIKRIVLSIKNGSLVVVCIQNTAEKVRLLNQAIDFEKELPRLIDKRFTYTFEDKDKGHTSETEYRMVVVLKGEH